MYLMLQGELQSSQLARRYNEYRQILQELRKEVLSKVLLWLPPISLGDQRRSQTRVPEVP
jgi:hypothetical protein